MTHHNNHHHENLSMMDTVTTKYGKTTFVTVSRTLAIILVLIFFICLVITGLLVYSFTSGCAAKNETTAGEAIVTDQSDRDDIVRHATEVPEQRRYDTTTVAAAAAAATTPATPTTTTTTPSDKRDATTRQPDVRLPDYVVPHAYEIHLIPFVYEGNFTFHGEETILINVTEACRNLTLHAVDLRIDAVKVTNINNETVSEEGGNRVRENKKNEFVVVELDGVLEAGQQYYVYIKFRGVLNDMLEGFYRSSYVENGVTKWLAATQFQPTDARRAFPCFDEPAFKAKFRINIARPEHMTAISNMPKTHTTSNVKNLPGYVWDHFQESVPMSTYLVAFVVSEFQNIGKGIFKVWARPSALSQAKFALEIGPTILRYYEQFFGIKYPLPKVDLVAIPDFSAGAMENWGLLTFRELVLLYEKGQSSTSNKQGIAHYVAHELAHQWFGNLVTPVWWEDLWLNEGFATYVQYLGANAVNQKWKEMDLFVVAELQDSLSLDALKTSHPISVKVNNPAEVNDIFDGISYSKGASIIRMMRDFLGDKAFQSGLQKYLKSRIYKNAEQDDLWQTMTEETLLAKSLPGNATIKTIMDSWTLQTGYPVVTVRKLDNGDLNIEQARYLLDREHAADDQTLWWVPITVLDSAEKNSETWLKKERQTTVKEAVSSDTAWYLVNVRQTGYYRVNYDEANWKALIGQLQGNGHTLIHPINRAQIIDDALNLAFAGYLNYDIALNATLYLVHEREYVPWKAALNNIQFLHSMFVRSGHFDKFKTYFIALLKDFYHELTFRETPDEDPTRISNRMEIVDLACKLGLKDCVLQAVRQFQNWRNSANPDRENLINRDLRHTVYCTAIGDGGQDEWDFAWTRFLNTNVDGDRYVFLASLACSKDVWILSRYLERSVTDDSGIRKHDVSRVFASVADNPIGQDLVYRFLKTHWKRIRDYLGPNSIALSTLVRATTRKFNTLEEVNDFESFFERHREEFGVATRTAQQAIEQAQANTRWINNYFDVVRRWLERARVD